jgi:hypothetical protein
MLYECNDLACFVGANSDPPPNEEFHGSMRPTTQADLRQEGRRECRREELADDLLQRSEVAGIRIALPCRSDRRLDASKVLSDPLVLNV